jgi:type IV pilus assembly protein PilC
MITQMAGIEEESGALDGVLDKCAVYYKAEVNNAVNGLTALMEPMIMLKEKIMVKCVILKMLIVQLSYMG